jgi:hypothetical protein
MKFKQELNVLKVPYSYGKLTCASLSEFILFQNKHYVYHFVQSY